MVKMNTKHSISAEVQHVVAMAAKQNDLKKLKNGVIL